MIEDRILQDMQELREVAESTGTYYGFWNLMMDAEACIQGKRTILPPELIEKKLLETIAELRRKKAASH
jgi:hypothetical protein